MAKRKEAVDKNFKKRSLEELKDGSYLLTIYGPAIIFDYFESPYTIFYFIFKEGWNNNHLNLLKIILKKLNKIKFSIVATDDVADIIKKELCYLLSLKIVIHYGIDNDKDVDYTKVCNYSFIDYIEDQGDVVFIKINENFYNVMDKYFQLEQ